MNGDIAIEKEVLKRKRRDSMMTMCPNINDNKSNTFTECIVSYPARVR